MKTRKNSKKGGSPNWRANRSLKHKPLYLNTKLKLNEDLDKYFDGNTLDLSSYQKDLIEGTDSEKEKAREDLRNLSSVLKRTKDKLKSFTFNVGLLISGSLGTILNTSKITSHVQEVKGAINEMKVKLSIDDVIQTIEKLLKDTNVEVTTINPLVYKKVNSKPKNANIIVRNGELVVKESTGNNKRNRKTFEPTSVN